MYCFDTDMVIAIIQNTPAATSWIKKAATAGEQTVITPLTVYELYKGVERSGSQKEQERVVNFLANTKTLHFSENILEYAGRLFSHLEMQGRRIADVDILIGMIARENDCTLVTGNIRHFERIDGLRLESWRDV